MQQRDLFLVTRAQFLANTLTVVLTVVSFVITVLSPLIAKLIRFIRIRNKLKLVLVTLVMRHLKSSIERKHILMTSNYVYSRYCTIVLLLVYSGSEMIFDNLRSMVAGTRRVAAKGGCIYGETDAAKSVQSLAHYLLQCRNSMNRHSNTYSSEMVIVMIINLLVACNCKCSDTTLLTGCFVTHQILLQLKC